MREVDISDKGYSHNITEVISRLPYQSLIFLLDHEFQFPIFERIDFNNFRVKRGLN